MTRIVLVDRRIHGNHDSDRLGGSSGRLTVAGRSRRGRGRGARPRGHCRHFIMQAGGDEGSVVDLDLDALGGSFPIVRGEAVLRAHALQPAVLALHHAFKLRMCNTRGQARSVGGVWETDRFGVGLFAQSGSGRNFLDTKELEKLRLARSVQK